jgi:hypothetical protein
MVCGGSFVPPDEALPPPHAEMPEQRMRAMTISVPEFPIFIAVGDFNGDGKLDLATANYDAWSVTILLGNGDGTFTAGANGPILAGNVPYSVTVGDFNQDGIPDLAVADSYDNTVTVLVGNGDGTFSRPLSPISVGTHPQSLAVGDFNEDGVPDMAVDTYGDGVNPSNLAIIQTGLGETVTATATGMYPVGVGNHNIDASYGGDANYSGSTSSAITVIVPEITSISPSSGLPGTFVKIVGTNFGAYQSGGSSVAFNGISAQVINWTPTTIEAIAPPESSAAPTGVTTGPVVVAAYNPLNYTAIASNGIVFTVPTSPTITGLSPVAGPIGTNVTISGFNFGTSPSVGSIAFNGVPASPTTWGSETIMAPVPFGATTGPVEVTVAGVTSTSQTYEPLAKFRI